MDETIRGRLVGKYHVVPKPSETLRICTFLPKSGRIVGVFCTGKQGQENCTILGIGKLLSHRLGANGLGLFGTNTLLRLRGHAREPQNNFYSRIQCNR